MGINDAESMEVTSRGEWRRWLEKNHKTRPGLWLVTYKKHVKDKHVPWPDVVKEAICFGWIDSRTRRVDEERMSVFVTRRKPGSNWSAVNKAHVAELERDGLLAPAGRAVIEAARTDGSWSFLDDIEALEEPPDLVKALDKVEDARNYWNELPGSVRKRCLYHVKIAKTEKTRIQRIESVVDQCKTGQRPAS